jgi:hypothetical protein
MVRLAGVGVRHDMLDNLLQPEDESNLSLAKCFKFMENFQTPTTTSVHDLQHLLQRIWTFDTVELRNRPVRVSKLLVDTVGSDAIVGNLYSPVITIRSDRIPHELAQR